MDIVKETYWWSEVRQEIENIVQSCQNCILLQIGDLISRSFSITLHEMEKNQVSYAELLYIG